jgi:hypothetical protein
MVDDFLLMRRKQKDQWRQREEARRQKRMEIDSSPTNESDSKPEFIDKEATPNRSRNEKRVNQEGYGNKSYFESTISCQTRQEYKTTANKHTTLRNCDDKHTTNRNCDDSTSKKVPLIVGFAHTKASPSSSVSLSQSPGKKLKKDAHWNVTLKVNSTFASVRNSVLAKVDSDSSSEDDENLLAVIRANSRKKDDQEANQDSKPSQQVGIIDRETSNNCDDNNLPLEKNHTNSASREKTIRSETNTDSRVSFLDNDSSEDEDLLLVLRKNGNIDYHEGVKQKSLGQKSPSFNASVENQQSDPSQVPKRPVPKIYRNPLTKMREMGESADIAIMSATETKFNERDDTKLWSDGDDNFTESSIKDVKYKRKRADNRVELKTDKQSRQKNPPNQDGATFVDDDLSIEDITDEEELEKEIKPFFKEPNFGPFEFLPLKISHANSEDEYYEVPASINRYLPYYQRDGVSFIFDKAIAPRRGAILGDGKSFQ